VKLAASFLLGTKIILLALAPRGTAAPGPQEGAPIQHFVCNTGYTVERCRKDLAVLRSAIAKYPVAELGDWTWILVRSEDWKAILVPRGLDPDGPAFTYYAKRETFIEEALLREVPGRHRELLLKWNMSMRDLLDFAIAHELGHALCNEKDEWKANLAAKMLREGNSPSCEVNIEAKTQTGKTR
jgi:hypothetical protein